MNTRLQHIPDKASNSAFHNMSNLSAAIDYIESHNLIGLKAGHERPSFLPIWMVVANNRIFARSWGLAENSWYNSFLQNPLGEIQCGERIYSIRATPLANNAALSEEINQAYLKKYNYGQNAYYAQGIIQPRHVARTMEFDILD